MDSPDADVASYGTCGYTETTDWVVEQLPVGRNPPVRVAVESLRIAGSPRTSGEDPEHVRVLAETPERLPPIIVHRASMWVIDGRHRVRAAELRGQDEIEARFFDGDETHAFVVAVKANIAHGLPLSLADRKAAAIRIVASHPQWSDRMIASVAGLTAKTVAELRAFTDKDASTKFRIGRDGRARPINSAERREVARQLIIRDPSLSLRQVARATGISPETARSVRSRLDGSHVPALPRQNRLPRTADDPRPIGRQDQRRPAGGRAQSMRPGLPLLVRELKADPSLRFTETGRTLLRLLDAHAIIDEKWASLTENVPPHCKDTIANVALQCSEAWKMFAKRLTEQDMCNTASRPKVS